MVATLKTGVIQEPSSGTANLTLDASGGVTVGQNLTVAGTTTFTGGSTFTGNATAAAFIPSGSTVPTNGLYRPAANTVGLATNSTNALYIDSSQNVGIGTTSPSGRLNVVNNLATVEERISTTQNAYAELYLNTWALDRARIRAEAANPGAGSGTGSGALSFWVAQNPTMTEAMRIDSSGNVGIGTNAPNSKLEVTSRITASDGGGASRVALNIESNTTAQSYSGINSYNYGTSTARSLVLNESGGSVGIGIITPSSYGTLVVSAANSFTGITTGDFSTIANNAGIYIRSTGSAGISWANGGSLNFYRGGPGSLLSATIDSSGNLLVGTTSALGKFASSASSGPVITIDASSTNDALMNWTSGGVQKVQTYWQNANNRYYVVVGSAGGLYVTSGGTSWTSASDERVKNIIEPITDGAKKVSNLRAVIGSYKSDPNNTRKAFLIAQDVQAVLPEAVDASNTDELGLQYTDVIPLLVAAIQELKAELDALKTKVGA